MSDRMNRQNRHKRKIPPAVRAVIGIGAACALLLACLGLRILYSFLVPIRYTTAERTAEEPETVSGESWMSGLSDELLLTQLTIPGTHDSATENIIFPYSFSCQQATVDEQLAMGFRFFDLRCRVIETQDGEQKAVLHHGSGICRAVTEEGRTELTQDMVYEDIEAYLTAHPTECVIVMVTPRGDGTDVELILSQIRECIEAKPSAWYTENRIPTLGEVRGKIVLLVRGSTEPEFGIGICYAGEEISEETTGLSGTLSCEGSLVYQDESSLGVVGKWKVFSGMLEESTDPEQQDLLRINYLSCSSGLFGLPSPKENARRLNPKLMALELPAGDYGVILVDFGSAEVAEKLYRTNFMIEDENTALME